MKRHLETLEDRLAPANLSVVAVTPVGADGAPLAEIVYGERFAARVEYRAEELAATDRHRVSAEYAGLAVRSAEIVGAGVGSVTVGGWYAGVEAAALTATVDALGQVVENDEGDNTAGATVAATAPTDAPRFVSPVGVPIGSQWVLSDSHDHDPRPGRTRDSRGGPLTYDGHQGLDFSPAGADDFQQMDHGAPVFAAAAGTVVMRGVADFDRHDVRVPTAPANFVVVDHGGGWRTEYYHFATDTVTVDVGDTVASGQLLGTMGSSGNSNGPHVHFGLSKDGNAVDPTVAADLYWRTPPLYPADAPRVLGGSGVSDSDPLAERFDVPRSRDVFGTHYAGDVYAWVSFGPFRPGERLNFRWFSPDGRLQASGGFTADRLYAAYDYYRFIDRDWGDFPGRWEVVVDIDGTELAREEFFVSDDPALADAEAEVFSIQDGTLRVTDGRTTPLPLAGGHRVAVVNTGPAPLTISEWSFPNGVRPQAPPPTVVAAGTAEALTLEVVPGHPNAVFGDVSFRSDDADRPLYTFAVSGPATGTPTGRLDVDLPRTAVAYTPGLGPVSVGRGATVAADGPIAGSRLVAEIVAGIQPGDRLSLANTGTLTVQDGSVFENGRSVAAVVEEGERLEVAFGEAATAASLASVAAAVHYESLLAVPPTTAREVSFGLLDPSGAVGTADRRSVVFGAGPVFPDDAVRPPTSRPQPAPAAAQVAVFSGGLWQFDVDRDGTVDRRIAFGGVGDEPVLVDWNGDGRLDTGVFMSGTWMFDTTADGAADTRFDFGRAGDLPFLADFDGDGLLDVGVYGTRDGLSTWTIDHTTADGRDLAADFTLAYGIPGDRPFVGDWDGDGMADLGLYRNGAESGGSAFMQFFVDTDRDGGAADTEVWFGIPGDEPFLGDSDADGRLDPGVFRFNPDVGGGVQQFFFDTARDGGVGEDEVWLAVPEAGQRSVAVPVAQSVETLRVPTAGVGKRSAASGAAAADPMADLIDLALMPA